MMPEYEDSDEHDDIDEVVCIHLCNNSATIPEVYQILVQQGFISIDAIVIDDQWF